MTVFLIPSTGFGAHSAYYSIGTEGSNPGVKEAGAQS